MPSFYTIFSLFMIFSDIAWEEIINDLEMFELMELQTTNVCRVSVSQSYAVVVRLAVTSQFVLAIYGPGLGRLSVRLIIVNSNITAPHHNTQQDLLSLSSLASVSIQIVRAVSWTCQKLQLKCFDVIKPWNCSISTTNNGHLHFYADYKL